MYVNLSDFCRFGGEYPEGVVPEPAGEDESAVDGHDEAVASHLHALAEVVAQVTFDLEKRTGHFQIKVKSH